MRFWQILLFPFSVVFDLITRIRNHLYNINYKPSFEFDTNVICVGNIAMGGTGKSPMIIYLASYFQRKNRNVAVLSRGYGRKTKGVRIANDQDNPDTIGDEPYMIYQQLKPKVFSVVGEDRAYAIPVIIHENPHVDVILMDDGFQHRSVRPGFNVILSDFNNPFFNDYIVPSGRLRESSSNLKRAQAIIFTKCPEDISEKEIARYQEKTKVSAGNVPVFFTSIRYGRLIGNGKPIEVENTFRIIAFSGIANDQSFVQYLDEKFNLLYHKRFADHHHYTEKEINELVEGAVRENASLVTTQKDWVKISKFIIDWRVPIYVLPIEVNFIDKENEFLDILEGSLKEYRRNQVND